MKKRKISIIVGIIVFIITAIIFGCICLDLFLAVIGIKLF